MTAWSMVPSRVEIVPNCARASYTRGGMILLAVLVLLALCIWLSFLVAGAWPICGWGLLEFLVITSIVRDAIRHRSDRELILITERNIVIRRYSASKAWETCLPTA